MLAEFAALSMQQGDNASSDIAKPDQRKIVRADANGSSAGLKSFF